MIDLLTQAVMNSNDLTQPKLKVLIISDEPETADLWGYPISQLSVDVVLIGINQEPGQVWANEMPDLIILEDFNTLPEELELCRKLRAETIVPILYLTAKNDEAFLLEAYRAGADDCITFPVTPRLFQAKVKAWLRRTHSLPMVALDEIQASSIRLNPAQKRLTYSNGRTIRLTALEARLLYLLMSHPGRVFETEHLVEKVWGYYGSGDSKLLKNLVYRLRRKIEQNPAEPCYLLTEGSLGYKFQGD